MWFKRFLSIGVMVLLTACSYLSKPVPDTASNDHHNNSHQSPASMEKAQTFFQQGKYSEALFQYRRLLKSNHESTVETSQFQIAYILAFYKNSKKDYGEALNEFQLFIKKYPSSSLKEEAANWIFLIDQYLSKKSENEKLRDDIKKLVDIDIEAEQKQNQLR